MAFPCLEVFAIHEGAEDALDGLYSLTFKPNTLVRTSQSFFLHAPCRLVQL
jgi:hypothetical protein